MATIKERINTVTESVTDGKSEIASAITNMGVPTPNNATFIVMAENIRKISATRCEAVYIYVDNNSRVTMDCLTEGSTIWYRIKGDSNWIEYAGPIPITVTTIYEAYATALGYLPSEIIDKECVPVINYNNYFNTTINMTNNSSQAITERIYCGYNNTGQFCTFLGGILKPNESSTNKQNGSITLPTSPFTPNTIYLTSSNQNLKMKVTISLNGKVILDKSGIDGAANRYPIAITSYVQIYDKQTDNYVVTVIFTD